MSVKIALVKKRERLPLSRNRRSSAKKFISYMDDLWLEYDD
jgi:hypothetical protein